MREIIAYLDINDRPRVKVGYVGEDGIKPLTLYEVIDGEFSEVII